MLTHADRAASIVMAHTAAVFLVEDRPWPMAYTAAFGGEGLVVVVPDRDLLDVPTAELHIPDESLELRDDSAVAMASFVAGPVSTMDQMRWEAYHGEPPSDRFAILKIDAVRISGEVLDAAELDLANPLASEQAALCKLANRPSLAEAVERHTGVAPEGVRAVGVDPLGVHARGAFIVHRLRFPERARDADHASVMIESLLGVSL